MLGLRYDVDYRGTIKPLSSRDFVIKYIHTYTREYVRVNNDKAWRKVVEREEQN